MLISVMVVIHSSIMKPRSSAGFCLFKHLKLSKQLCAFLFVISETNKRDKFFGECLVLCAIFIPGHICGVCHSGQILNTHFSPSIAPNVAALLPN